MVKGECCHDATNYMWCAVVFFQFSQILKNMVKYILEAAILFYVISKVTEIFWASHG